MKKYVLIYNWYDEGGDKVSSGIYKIFCGATGKSYIGQSKNILKPWITYEYDYKMLNLFFIRFGFSINEVI